MGRLCRDMTLLQNAMNDAHFFVPA